jgi:3-deoxy-D-manno-octulosonic-acid transferase
MIAPLVGATYRGLMRTAAAGARAVSAVPGLPEHWRGVGDRLGRLAPDDRARAAGAPALWVHAASVGELNAVRPLLAQLRLRFPGRSCIVSTLTRTGLALARTLPEVHLSLLLPLDDPATVERLLREVRLEAFFFTETEIWPVWLAALAAHGVPSFMVSGRVSERTVARAWLLRPLYRHGLATVDCCMQTDEDAARIVTLGAEPLRVHVAGSLKFDVAEVSRPDGVGRLAALLEEGGRAAIVGGSTHEGEERLLVDAYDRLARGHRGLVLVLAPRHPERMADVAALVEARGLGLVRYSAIAAGEAHGLPAGPTVVLVDVVGPLAHCYALGTVAFVGGSLVPVGGHNVLEPARASRPILVGPHTANARDVVERLVRGGGALRVESGDALAWTLDHLLAHPDEATAMGRRAHALVQTGQGAVDRHMRIIAARLTRANFVREAP